MATVEEYLARLTPEQREQYERVRRIVRSVVPDAGEKISYGMPTFTYGDKYLVYFGAYQHHMSIFPGTVKFTAADPIPEPTLIEMVRRRLAVLTRDPLR